MLSRTILLALVSAACFATVNADSCSPENEKCCRQVEDKDHLDDHAKGLLGLLRVDLDSLVGDVGLDCTNILDGSCSNNAACCSGNDFYLCPKENTVIVLPEDEITHVGTSSTGTKSMKPARGVVLAVGTTKAPANGKQHAMDVRLGDLVIYAKGKGKEVKVDRDEYLLLDREEIIAVAD
ncbi:hypothetical protein CNMCM5623_005646 [Aspergillus felis]|uniref:10 kDa chaperonin n=1 Tax=Aspergillus felis TaxID=1287682 RepID=A0A8H6QIP7_9EURO|nr:hypothetical protein CNMCM5623_005646 [Aspergillus felis]KAF7184620.1 hypothetical protein CNMCM7691_005863 [Aspergillus felis]